MGTDKITEIYETLAPMAGDYVNAQAEQIGQAQRSIGPLAANTMGQSQTAGLGNYTYNRLMRPQVDVMRDEIMTQGYANQLNRLLSDALNTARNNYNRRSRGGGGSGNGGTTSSSGQNKSGVQIDDEYTPTPTRWSKLPASYSWQDKDGNWHHSKREGWMDDQTWFDMYTGAKNQADSNKRGFHDGVNPLDDAAYSITKAAGGK